MSDPVQLQFLEERVEYLLASPERRMKGEVLRDGQLALQSFEMAAVSNLRAILRRKLGDWRRLSKSTPPLVGNARPGEDAQQRRLPGSIRADQQSELRRAELEVQAARRDSVRHAKRPSSCPRSNARSVMNRRPTVWSGGLCPRPPFLQPTMSAFVFEEQRTKDTFVGTSEISVRAPGSVCFSGNVRQSSRLHNFHDAIDSPPAVIKQLTILDNYL